MDLKTFRNAPARTPTASRVESLGCVRLYRHVCCSLAIVIESAQSPNASNGFALLLVFHEMVLQGGLEPPTPNL